MSEVPLQQVKHVGLCQSGLLIMQDIRSFFVCWRHTPDNVRAKTISQTEWDRGGDSHGALMLCGTLPTDSPRRFLLLISPIWLPPWY